MIADPSIERATDEERIPERRPFKPYGAVLDALYYKGPELLLSGPAGTGKSRGVLEKVHLVAENYPGARCLMVRKTRASLTESALVTWEEKVVPAGHAILRRPVQRRMRQAYVYPNGSEVIVGGMDNATKVMSTEWDLIYVQEGIELTEDDWEKLTTRLRNGVVPYQQIIGDTNPDAPKHWLKQRAGSGRLKLLESRHEDNPTLWDHATNDWTSNGQVYIARLDALTGARFQRLRHGRWVQAEGVVYEGWDAAVHVIDRFEIPASWPRYWSIDFGYTNPFCYNKDVEILTKSGWVYFSELTEGVEVGTVSPLSHAFEWQVPTDYISYEFDGEMIETGSVQQSASFSVTPDHQMVICNRKTGEWKKARADSLPQGSSIPTGWVPLEEGDEGIEFRIPAKGRPNRRRLPAVSRVAFAEFLGVWVADGSLHLHKNGYSKYVRVTQKNRVGDVRRILSALGWRWSESIHKTTGCIDFSIGSADLYDFLEEGDGRSRSRNKRLPSYVFSWGRSSLVALLQGMMIGDGHYRVLNEQGWVTSGESYSTSSSGLANDIQCLAAILGLPTSIKTEKRLSGHANPSTDRMFIIHFHTHGMAAVESLKLQKVPYKGPVYCVTVPNGMLVVRRKGRPMVCGNCWQAWAVDPDGRLYRYKEIYHTQRIVRDHARLIAEKTKNDPKPKAIICDHDAEDRATLVAEWGWQNEPAWKDISTGIQSVALRLRPAGDGKPRIFFLRDSLVETDPHLTDKKLPTCTEDEFDIYVWNTSDHRKKGEEPVDRDNHGMDALRYMVAYLDAQPRSPWTDPDFLKRMRESRSK